jgi:hypothetical protein
MGMWERNSSDLDAVGGGHSIDARQLVVDPVGIYMSGTLESPNLFDRVVITVSPRRSTK